MVAVGDAEIGGGCGLDCGRFVARRRLRCGDVVRHDAKFNVIGVEQRVHADNVTDNAAYVEGTVGTQFDDMSIDASRALGTYTTLAVPQRHTPPNVAVVLPSKR